MDNKDTLKRAVLYANIVSARGSEDTQWGKQIKTCGIEAPKLGFKMIGLLQSYDSRLELQSKDGKYLLQLCREKNAPTILVVDYYQLAPDYYRLCYILWALAHYYGIEVVPLLGEPISRETDPCFDLIASMFDDATSYGDK